MALRTLLKIQLLLISSLVKAGMYVQRMYMMRKRATDLVMLTIARMLRAGLTIFTIQEFLLFLPAPAMLLMLILTLL